RKSPATEMCQGLGVVFRDFPFSPLRAFPRSGSGPACDAGFSMNAFAGAPGPFTGLNRKLASALRALKWRGAEPLREKPEADSRNAPTAGGLSAPRGRRTEFLRNPSG